MRSRHLIHCLLILLCAVLSGCASFGPICETTGHAFRCVICGLKVSEAADGENTTPEDAPQEPLMGESITWYSGNEPIDDWAETVKITSVNIGRTVSWAYEIAPGNWRRTNRIHNDPNACIGWTTEIDGEMCGVIAEWLLPGQTAQARKIFKSDRGNMHAFNGKLKNFKPKSGQVFHVFVCGLNWRGVTNVKERSNAVKVIYP